jgi:hypothetical protein
MIVSRELYIETYVDCVGARQEPLDGVTSGIAPALHRHAPPVEAGVRFVPDNGNRPLDLVPPEEVRVLEVFSKQDIGVGFDAGISGIFRGETVLGALGRLRRGNRQGRRKTACAYYERFPSRRKIRCSTTVGFTILSSNLHFQASSPRYKYFPALPIYFIGHSFGTYLTGEGLLLYRSMNFERVYVAGAQ